MSKKRRSFAHLEREFEDKIVGWFQEQELLYRPDADGYSNKTKKDNVWAEGAQLLGIEEEHLRHFIRDMRTLFSKLIKPGKSYAEATNLTERKKWVLRRFGFLRNYIQHRRTGFSGRKEVTVEEDDDGELEEEDEEEIVVAVDSVSDIESQEEETEKSDTIDSPPESASESNLHTMTKTPTFTQRQIPKRPFELLNTTHCSTPRSTEQPILKKAKVVRKNASATTSRPQTDSPSAILTHPIAAMEEKEKEIIKQIRELVKADDQKKGMDEQMKSFLEMMGTSMMSLHPKRRHKTQRKLLNLMFDELDQQEKEDAQQGASPWCTLSATPVPHPHSTFGQQISEVETTRNTMPSIYIQSTMYSPKMPRSSVLTPIPNLSIVPTQSMPGPSMPQIMSGTSQFRVSLNPLAPSQQTQQPPHVQQSTPIGGAQRPPPISTSTRTPSSQRSSLGGAVETVIPSPRDFVPPSGNTDLNYDVLSPMRGAQKEGESSPITPPSETN